MHASGRPTATLNVFVKNVGSSGTIPAGWDFTLYNPSYDDQSGFWNLRVGQKRGLDVLTGLHCVL